ncbi:hypothetical protein SAMN06264364_1463 [Quadrisphaera granulorum]|uniref:Sodium:proton antiporter n=1 Tax=Quadrisphaera granulorum TaxID=317664 RepID=A0A316A9K2_9ACTN|nr:DUF6328 family protein [Quadrisphaera granulorum]PWJ46477.1 hypothetical protein BXY45_1463 [Quadrisphaera granulorum]SZE99035.1 hypothetical protein SAMN06264364_1463 [Quadrisphaera granulorum]
MHDDDDWRDQRGETALRQLDRHWAELLQELRVVQTGVQVLTGFLLTLPFQQRFEGASTWQVVLYLVAVGFAVLATALFAAPVSVHRALFRRRARGELVMVGHRCAVAGLMCLAGALVAVVLLVVAVLLGGVAGVVAGGVAAVVFAGLWGVLPLTLRRRALLAATPPRA